MRDRHTWRAVSGRTVGISEALDGGAQAGRKTKERLVLGWVSQLPMQLGVESGMGRRAERASELARRWR